MGGLLWLAFVSPQGCRKALCVCAGMHVLACRACYCDAAAHIVLFFWQEPLAMSVFVLGAFHSCDGVRRRCCVAQYVLPSMHANTAGCATFSLRSVAHQARCFSVRICHAIMQCCCSTVQNSSVCWSAQYVRCVQCASVSTHVWGFQLRVGSDCCCALPAGRNACSAGGVCFCSNGASFPWLG